VLAELPVLLLLLLELPLPEGAAVIEGDADEEDDDDDQVRGLVTIARQWLRERHSRWIADRRARAVRVAALAGAPRIVMPGPEQR
jgi:hypothetical protein